VHGVADLIEKITQQPRKLFAIVVCITALTYLPLSALYSPWYWAQIGPFEVQATFAPQYAIYFFVGLAIGSQGLDRGIFDEEGTLVRRWPLWTGGAFAAFFLWIIPAALIAKMPNVPVKALSVIGDLGLVIFAAAACLSMTGLFQRFARGRLPVIGDISEHGAFISSTIRSCCGCNTRCSIRLCRPSPRGYSCSPARCSRAGEQAS